MKLSDYLTERKMRPTRFAEQLGVTPAAVSRILNGRRKPSIELAAKIERETQGMVSLQDWSGAQEPPADESKGRAA